MPKNILQDVLPPEKRSIRDIPIPETRRRKVNHPISDIKNSHHNDEKNQKNLEEKEESKANYLLKDKRTYSRKLIWTSVVVAVLILVFAVSTLFRGTTLKVTQKQQNLIFTDSMTYEALKNSVNADLSYDVIRLDKDYGVSVNATGEEKKETKASGKIVIFNNFSTSPQKLVKNTRFETPEGLIYRIQNDVTVPGQSKSGGELIPGSLEVMVYADEPGEKYNIGLKDFTIPGFKGNPRFDKINAKSKTEMAGGFVGVAKKVTDEALAKAKQDIENNLKDELIKEAISQVPKDFILYNNGIKIDFNSLPQTNPNNNSVTVNEKGTLYGVIFNRSNLNDYIAKKAIPDLGEEKVIIKKIDNLDFQIKNKDSFDPTKGSPLSFTLKGESPAVWDFDENKLKNDIAGKTKDSLNGVISTYPGIESASATVLPFWSKTFPVNINDIKIEKIVSTN